MDECEIAWIAGIVEGEGSILLLRSKSGYPTASHIKVSMSDEDVIRRIHRVTGIGTVFSWAPKTGRGKKVMHTWHCSRKDSVPALLERLRPWMGKRRAAKIDEVLAGARPPGYNGNRPRGSASVKTHLTEEQVLKMRLAYAKGGVSQTELAEEVGLGQSRVSRILRGVTWAHVGGPLKP